MIMDADMHVDPTRVEPLFPDLDGADWRWLIGANLAALLPLGCATLVIWLPYQFYLALGAPLAASSAAIPIGWVIVVGALIVLGSFILHEGLHAAALRLQGYRARIHWARGYFFATTGPGEVISRRAYAIMALTPLLAMTALGGLSLIFLPVVWGQIGVIALLLNAAASIGDLAVTARVLACPPGSGFLDGGSRGILVLRPAAAGTDASKKPSDDGFSESGR